MTQRKKNRGWYIKIGSKNIIHIFFFLGNNLYGLAMSEYIPHGGFNIDEVG